MGGRGRERERWERERQVQYIQERTAITWVNKKVEGKDPHHGLQFRSAISCAILNESFISGILSIL